jgi:transcription antitermination factor NusG
MPPKRNLRRFAQHHPEYDPDPIYMDEDEDKAKRAKGRKNAPPAAEIEETDIGSFSLANGGNTGPAKPRIVIGTNDQGEIVEIPIDTEKQWYVVHCYSGYEKKVETSVRQRIETMGMHDKIFDVVVPTEEEIEVKEGKRRTIERRVFPGYILVQMKMDEDSWFVVRNTPGVTGFVGMGDEPTPLRPDEVAQIMRRMEAESHCRWPLQRLHWRRWRYRHRKIESAGHGLFLWPRYASRTRLSASGKAIV